MKFFVIYSAENSKETWTSALTPWKIDEKLKSENMQKLEGKYSLESTDPRDTIRYDTIRDAILTCARKPT